MTSPHAPQAWFCRAQHRLPVLVFTAILTTGLSTGLSGCKARPAIPDDAALTSTIQSQLAGDSSLAGQSVQASVQNGVVTINGTVANDAQRTIAARDAAGVSGVKEVINNLAVPSPTVASVVTAPPAPVIAPTRKSAELVPQVRPTRTVAPPQSNLRDREPAPIERPQQAYNPPAALPLPRQLPPPPPPPPQPTFQQVTVASGSVLPVRVTQTLDSETAQEGQTFTGTVSSDVLVNGLVAIPSGSSVTGRVDAVQEAAHFKGSSLLTVSLTGVSRRGERLSLATEPYTVEGKGRGKNTAIKTGGGAAVGAVLGGIFGGGKGAAIGAAAGGGAGAGINGITRGEQVQIPSETIVRFRLTTPVTLRVRTDGAAAPRSQDPALQQHPQY